MAESPSLLVESTAEEKVAATAADNGGMAAEVESGSRQEAAVVLQVELGLKGPGFEALLACNVVQTANFGFAGDSMAVFGSTCSGLVAC